MVTFLLFAGLAAAQEDGDGEATVEEDIGKSRDGSRTDDEAVQRLQELRNTKLKNTKLL